MDVRVSQEPARSIDLRLLVILVVVVLAALAAGAWLAWRAMGRVEGDVARLWALLATVALPVGVWAGFRLGHLEARGKLQGIDAGIGHVMDAASRTADLRIYTLRQVKQTQTQPPSMVVLPPLDPPAITVRPQLTSGESVEL